MGAVGADNIGDHQHSEGVGQPSDTPAPVVDNDNDNGGGLPSDNNEQQTPWERAKADGFLPDDYKEDPYELAKSWKNGQDFVKQANDEKSKRVTDADLAAKSEATNAEILGLVPEFMRNGMELTPEMEAKAKELNIDIRDLKLGAMEMRDNINKAYSVVGGEETYAVMMKDMGEVLSKEQMVAFNADLGGNASEFAIRGLHAAWQEKTGASGKELGGRVEGRVGGGGGVKGYTDQGEMLNDLAYLRTRGKNDKAALAKYNARKAATDDKVIYGR